MHRLLICLAITVAILLCKWMLMLCGRWWWRSIVMQASVRIRIFFAAFVRVVWVVCAVIRTRRRSKIRASEIPHVLVLLSGRRIIEILVANENILFSLHVHCFKKRVLSSYAYLRACRGEFAREAAAADDARSTSRAMDSSLWENSVSMSPRFSCCKRNSTGRHQQLITIECYSREDIQVSRSIVWKTCVCLMSWLLAYSGFAAPIGCDVPLQTNRTRCSHAIKKQNWSSQQR